MNKYVAKMPVTEYRYTNKLIQIKKLNPKLRLIKHHHETGRTLKSDLEEMA